MTIYAVRVNAQGATYSAYMHASSSKTAICRILDRAKYRGMKTEDVSIDVCVDAKLTIELKQTSKALRSVNPDMRVYTANQCAFEYVVANDRRTVVGNWLNKCVVVPESLATIAQASAV